MVAAVSANERPGLVSIAPCRASRPQRATPPVAAAVADDVPSPHPEVVRNILPGHFLMIDDGKLRLQVTQCDDDYFEARVLVGGMLSDRKG